MPHLPHTAARRGHGRLLVPYPRRGRGLEGPLSDPPLQDRDHPEAGQPVGSGSTPIESEIDAVVDDALQFAETSPWPDPATATRFVFAEPQLARDRPSSPPARRQPASREISYMQATLEGLSEEMARDPSIFVWAKGSASGAATSRQQPGFMNGTGRSGCATRRSASAGFVGLGCGAAMTGTRPVIDFMFADFVLDSVGEIINQIAKIQYMSSGRLKMPILLRGCIGIGHSAATHHSGNYYPMYAHFPGLRVVVPSTPYDAKGLLKQALRSSDPVIFLEHREILGVKGPVPEEDYEIEFGRAAGRSRGQRRHGRRAGLDGAPCEEDLRPSWPRRGSRSS